MQSFVKLLFLIQTYAFMAWNISFRKPFQKIKNKIFIEKFIAIGDEALNEHKSSLAHKHSNYANALITTGGKLSDIRRELDLSVIYADTSEQEIRTKALSFQWFTEGASESILSAQKKELLATKKENNQLAAEYSINCIELGNEGTALSFIESLEYTKKTDFHRYLPLSNIVSNHFQWAKKYKRHANLFKKMEESREIFESLIKKNSVCIVGNSPIEAGKGRGAEIDAHSLVIRFNNFSTNHLHHQDYGSKTDIWVRAGSTDVRDRHIDGLSFIVWEEDIWHTRILDSTSAQMVSHLESGIDMTYIPAHIHQELRKIADLATPSAGLVTCYWIYKIMGGLDPQSVFGFSMTDQIRNSEKKHYYKTTRRSARTTHHNWAIERHIFDRMLNGTLQYD